MDGWIILAESATLHPDGTTSMLRSGINETRAASTPVPFRAAIVARIEGDAADRGSHDLEINCTDEDGKDRFVTMKARFEFPPTGGHHVVVLALQTKLDDFGSYVFNLFVDRVLLGSWKLRVGKLTETTDAI